MANNEIKSNAEIYREQRKARLAKAAKKKKSHKGGKVISIIVKVLLIVLVVALSAYFVGDLFLDVFGTPQRLIVASKADGNDISIAEVNYYYRSIYQQTISTSQQLDQAYSGYGSSAYFNPKLDPADQDYVGTDAPENVKTWADYFEYMAPVKANLMNALYNEAIEKKFELTKEQQTELDENLTQVKTSLEENAKSAEFSVDNYVARTYGEGLTLESYLGLLEKDLFTEYYLTSVQENFSKNVTEKEINSFYTEHRDELDIATIRSFPISYKDKADDKNDPVYTKKEAKARAEKFVKEFNDEESFIAATKKYAAPSKAEFYNTDDTTSLDKDITKADLAGVSEDIGNWIFSTERKVNDVKIFDLKDQECYYVAFIVKTAAKDTRVSSADVRHILIEASTTDENGKTLSDEKVEENFKNAKAEAEKILKGWKDNKPTEKSFIALVEKHSDDTASVADGGLYKDISDNGKYVQEFTDWALEPHKVGDTGIVKTDYGYHIMYFVKASDSQAWEENISASIADENYSAYLDAHYNKAMENRATLNDKVLNFFIKRNAEKITELMMNSANSASSSLSF